MMSHGPDALGLLWWKDSVQGGMGLEAIENETSLCLDKFKEFYPLINLSSSEKYLLMHFVKMATIPKSVIIAFLAFYIQ